MPLSENQPPEEGSRSQRKEEVQALQKIGESLLKLTEEQLAKIELPDNLLAALKHAKSLSSNEAKRRQLQYIGKIMRNIDAEAIKLTLKRMQSIHEKNTNQFHKMEAWRNTLLEKGDEALNHFVSEYPNSERQQLRQLIRNALRDRKNNKNTGAETALFKYIRGVIESV